MATSLEAYVRASLNTRADICHHVTCPLLEAPGLCPHDMPPPLPEAGFQKAFQNQFSFKKTLRRGGEGIHSGEGIH
jgi:hypothetical protein